ELDVELLRRRVHGVGRVDLTAGAHDVGAADDDRARTAVVRDGHPQPVRADGSAVGPEDPADVRRVLERRVEVDVVGDLERQPRRPGCDRGPWPGVAAGALDGLVPDGPAPGHQGVQGRLCEVLAEGRELDDLAAFRPAQARWIAEDAEAGHDGQSYTGRGPGSAQWELVNRVRSGRKQR